jgi:ribosome-associated translation inhibitor RaiA
MDPEKFTVVTPVARRPTVTIIDIGSNYSKPELLARVKSQNASKFTGIELDENNFKIIFSKPHARNRDLYKAVVRVSDEVRKAISNAKNKLNIGLKSCPVFDDFFIRRCNKCQKLNHWKDDCPADNQVVCGKCSGEHETKNCTSEVIRCYNCVQAKHRDTNHETSFYKCTAYIEAQKKLESTINYYKNNPKN